MLFMRYRWRRNNFYSRKITGGRQVAISVGGQWIQIILYEGWLPNKINLSYNGRWPLYDKLMKE